jgi:hypothetical protein
MDQHTWLRAAPGSGIVTDTNGVPVMAGHKNSRSRLRLLLSGFVLLTGLSSIRSSLAQTSFRSWAGTGPMLAARVALGVTTGSVGAVSVIARTHGGSENRLAPAARSATVPGRGSVHIGTAQAVVDRTWKHDTTLYPHDPNCAPGGVCHYVVGNLHIEVYFGGASPGAIEFLTGFDPHPSIQKYWAFLTSLVPAGSKKTVCKRFASSGAPLGGPVRACIYTHGRTKILVAEALAGFGKNAFTGRVLKDGRFQDVHPNGS